MTATMTATTTATATATLSKYQRARQKKIDKMGYEQYRAEENRKQRERRARAKAKRNEGKADKPKRPSDPNEANSLFILSKMGKEDFKAFLEVKETLEALKGYKKSTQKKYIHSVRLKVKDNEEAYNEYTKAYNLLSEELNKEQGDNKLTAEEVKNWVHIDVLTHLYKQVKDPRAKALIALYTLIPPRRRGMAVSLTLANSKISKGNLNYLVVNKSLLPSKIILNNYKTSETYGQYIINLTGRTNKILRDILKNHIVENKIEYNKPVFPNTKGDYMKPDNMSLEFKNIFKTLVNKDITFNLVRHIWISYFLSTPTTINEKKDLALKMGHSVAVQDTYKRILKF